MKPQTNAKALDFNPRIPGLKALLKQKQPWGKFKYFSNTGLNIVVHGPPGTGKTILALQTAVAAAVFNSRRVFYLTKDTPGRELYNHLRDSFDFFGGGEAAADISSNDDGTITHNLSFDESRTQRKTTSQRKITFVFLNELQESALHDKKDDLPSLQKSIDALDKYESCFIFIDFKDAPIGAASVDRFSATRSVFQALEHLQPELRPSFYCLGRPNDTSDMLVSGENCGCEKFTADEVIDVQSFIDRLKSEPERKLCPVSFFLFKELGAFESAAKAFLKGEIDELVTLLNNVVGGESIYMEADKDRFNKMNLCSEARRMIQQPSTVRDRRRLNRLLLEDAYPSAFSRSRSPYIVCDSLSVASLRENLNLQCCFDQGSRQSSEKPKDGDTAPERPPAVPLFFFVMESATLPDAVGVTFPPDVQIQFWHTPTLGVQTRTIQPLKTRFQDSLDEVTTLKINGAKLPDGARTDPPKAPDSSQGKTPALPDGASTKAPEAPEVPIEKLLTWNTTDQHASVQFEQTSKFLSNPAPGIEILPPLSDEFAHVLGDRFLSGEIRFHIEKLDNFRGKAHWPEAMHTFGSSAPMWHQRLEFALSPRTDWRGHEPEGLQ